jgi:hypothetical protein
MTVTKRCDNENTENILELFETNWTKLNVVWLKFGGSCEKYKTNSFDKAKKCGK